MNGEAARVNLAGNPCLPALRDWAARQKDCCGWADLAASDRCVAVAFSGGADSTALLLAANTLWPGRVVAVHVHHGLQTAADAFAQHAEAFCAAWQVACHVVHVQAGHAAGQSPEDAARQARYTALAEQAQRLCAVGVLLGQHAQDQVETVLLALTRGAGLPGLAAMPATMRRHGVVFGRPMLPVSGDAVRHWLQAQGIGFVFDPSNADERYTRNRIRAQLLPVLHRAFPQFVHTFARSARHAAQAQSLLQEYAQADLQTVGNPPSIAALQQLSPQRQVNLLRYWLRTGWGVGPSEAQMAEVLRQVQACQTRGHRIHLKVGPGRLLRRGETLHYEPSL